MGGCVSVGKDSAKESQLVLIDARMQHAEDERMYRKHQRMNSQQSVAESPRNRESQTIKSNGKEWCKTCRREFPGFCICDGRKSAPKLSPASSDRLHSNPDRRPSGPIVPYRRET